MTDSELNEKLAKLCGKVLVESQAMSDRWLLVNPPDGCLTVWNPVEDWQQVHDFVIPAVHRLPLQVQIIFNPSKTTVIMNNGITPMFLKQTKHNYSSPRLLCELALKAAEKLEETT